MTAVKANGTQSTEYDVLYRCYIHMSHQYYSSGFVNPNKIEKHPNVSAPNGKRELFYNSPADAIDPDNYEFAKSWDLTENEA